jgi:hypothetical protein
MISLSAYPTGPEYRFLCKPWFGRGDANISATSGFPKDFLTLLPLQTAVSTRGRGRGAVRTNPPAATAQPPLWPTPGRGGNS